MNYFENFMTRKFHWGIIKNFNYEYVFKRVSMKFFCCNNFKWNFISFKCWLWDLVWGSTKKRKKVSTLNLEEAIYTLDLRGTFWLSPTFSRHIFPDFFFTIFWCCFFFLHLGCAFGFAVHLLHCVHLCTPSASWISGCCPPSVFQDTARASTAKATISLFLQLRLVHGDSIRLNFCSRVHGMLPSRFNHSANWVIADMCYFDIVILYL